MKTLSAANICYNDWVKLTRRLAKWALAAAGAVFILFAAPVFVWAQSGLIFSDSFESGNGSAWTWPGFPSASYPSSGCQNGARCGRYTISSGKFDESVFWEKELGNATYADLYLKGWWKFPTNWQFGGGSGDPNGKSIDFKAIIIETGNRVNRCFINFRTSSATQANVAFLCEGSSPRWELGTGAQMRADGQWHSVELHVQRTAGGGRVDVWFDNVQFINSNYTVCDAACPTIYSVKFGAYENWTSPQTQSFDFDNAVIATSRIGGGGADTTAPGAPQNLNVQ